MGGTSTLSKTYEGVLLLTNPKAFPSCYEYIVFWHQPASMTNSPVSSSRTTAAVKPAALDAFPLV